MLEDQPLDHSGCYRSLLDDPTAGEALPGRRLCRAVVRGHVGDTRDTYLLPTLVLLNLLMAFGVWKLHSFLHLSHIAAV